MHHLIELFSNPWVALLIIFIFFAEYIPFSSSLYKNIGSKFTTLSQWFIDSYENRLYDEREIYLQNRKIDIKFNNILARIIFFILSSIVIIFLEIFWEMGFKTITKKLEKSSLAFYAEDAIRKMHPWAVLAIFALPFIFMELLGILALSAFMSAQFWLGVSLYASKVLLFIPVHFILHVAKSKLLTIAWFKRRYEIVNSILIWFKKTQTYIKVHNIIINIKAYLSALKERFYKTVNILKKAFEQSDLLSDECEQIRQDIIKAKSSQQPTGTMYKKFFECIDRHIKLKNEKH